MTLIEKARHLRALIEKAAASLPDEDALNAMESSIPFCASKIRDKIEG